MVDERWLFYIVIQVSFMKVASQFESKVLLYIISLTWSLWVSKNFKITCDLGVDDLDDLIWKNEEGT